MHIVKADSMTGLLTREEVEAILAEPLLMRLGFNDQDGWPAVAPVWVLYENERLWTTIEAGSRKARRLAEDDRAYFAIDASGPTGTYGVRGRAHARVMTDRALAEKLTRQSLLKYLGTEEGDMAEAMLRDAREGETAVVELTPVKWAAWRY